MANTVRVIRSRTFDEISPPISPTPTPTRTLLYEGEFSSTWKTDYPWQFTYPTDSEITEAHSTMNGHNCAVVTFAAGATADHRWGGILDLPTSAFASEGWFSCDYMIVSPFSLPYSSHWGGARSDAWISNGSARGCDAGWEAFFNPIQSNYPTNDVPANPKLSEMYWYDALAYQQASIIYEPITYDTVLRVEIYWKINTAYNTNNGIMQMRWDNGTATAHSTPSTIRASRTNATMYCGSETNRNAASVAHLIWGIFWGGPVDPAWAPTIDSTFQIGYFKIEKPAT